MVEFNSPNAIAKAVVFAILPAFVGYFILGLIANEPIIASFFVFLGIFTYLFQLVDDTRKQASKMLFWIAVELLIMPFAILIFTVIFAGTTGSAAGAAGATIGGTFLMIIAFVVGVPLAAISYLISTRLD
jgi:hypothetical protein